jgi:competence protein ComGC
MITVGTSCSITHDIIVEGQMAFRAGEAVVVEQVAPNPQRPEYKYVVTSSSLQKAFQLSDGDLMPSAPAYEAPPPVPQGAYQQSAPPPSGYEPGQQPFAAYGAGVPPAQYPVQTEKKSTNVLLIVLAVVGALVLVIVLVPMIIGIPVYLNARSNAQRRTCQSNLRTVDGAIQSYESMMPNDEAPTSLDDLTQPGTNVLRRIPTCPSGNRPYIWVPGTPPEISCPNNATHTI